MIVINGSETSLPVQSRRADDGSAIDLRRLVSLLLPPLVVMAVIFVLSAQTSDAHDRPLWEILLRKLGHVTEYTALTLVWWRAIVGLRLGAPRTTALLLAAVVSLAYAGTDEFHQTFVAGRTGTPVDVLIDSIGVALACALARRYAWRRRRTVGPSRPSAA